MNTRITVPAVAPIPTALEAEGLAADIVKNVLRERKLKTRMDEQLAWIRKDYEKALALLAAERVPMVATLQRWAEANKERFAGKKSLELIHATVGWRTGQPQLKLLARQSWKKVLAAIKAAGLVNWVRTKEEPNKEKMIEDRALSAALSSVGVKVVQEEGFFVDPKVESLPSRQEAPAEKARAA